MNSENHSITCSIFLNAESVIKRAEIKMKEAIGSKEKQYYASDILLEAEVLLICPSCNAENSDCRRCHSASHKYIQRYEQLPKGRELKEAINE